MKWILSEVPDASVVARLQDQLRNLPEPLARSLVLRGIDTFEKARSFFRDTRGDLHDPFDMDGMQAAAERLSSAIRDQEHVAVYGDYDADGVTSTALITHFLRQSGVDTDYYIPSRFEDGYGLHERGINRAAEAGTTLMVVVDCGSTALAEAVYAKELGIDLIICDHHTPGPADPHAVAVLNPKRAACTYPNVSLSACGIAYKLVCATMAIMGDQNPGGDRYLDLVAISTVCDMIPLEGENRILAREGLIELRQARRPSLRELALSARCTIESLSTVDIGFRIGPRLNAAGRIKDASVAVELLLADSIEAAAPLIAELGRLNNERRAQGAKFAREAVRAAKIQLESSDGHALVLHNQEWPPGLLGIAAGRLKDRFNRPTILLTTLRGKATGSARSVASVNIHDALSSCEELLDAFGGHAAAAGVTLPVENIEAFSQRLNSVIGEWWTPDSMESPQLYDADLDLRDVNQRFMNVLRQFSPHGRGNEEPVFRVANLKLAAAPRRVGSAGAHLKLTVRSKDGGEPMGAIGFSLGDKAPALESLESTYEVLASLQENTFMGRTSNQLKLTDIRAQTESTGEAHASLQKNTSMGHSSGQVRLPDYSV